MRAMLLDRLHLAWVHLLDRVDQLLFSYFAIAVVLAWVLTFVGAAYAYRYQTGPGPRPWRGFPAYCVPAELLRHKSFRLDVMFAVVRQLMPGAWFAPFLISNLGMALATDHALSAGFGVHARHDAPPWLWLLLLAGAMVVEDFMTFAAHYLQHKIPLLWELHKVHHSAEVLLPITNRRFHPLQGIMDNVFDAAGAGVFIGAACYALSLPVLDSAILGIDAYFLLNALSFYHLRHSHVRLGYGWLEGHLISPFQHQLHHSREERHWDRNFGLMFAWWDRMFGTLIHSDPAERYEQGLPKDIQPLYRDVASLYLRPLANIARMIWRARPRAPVDARPVDARPVLAARRGAAVP